MLTLPDNRPSRKQRFEAALKLAGLTQKEWCASVYQVSENHLIEVFKGERVPSRDLESAIDYTIQKYLPRDAA